MLLIPCPHCGPRPELEFTYHGEAHIPRPERPADLSDDQWLEFLYLRTNPRGPHAERWRHTHGCARFFNALRDTTTDAFTATYPPGHPRPDPSTANATQTRHPRTCSGDPVPAEAPKVEARANTNPPGNPPE